MANKNPPGFYSYEESDEIIQELSDADAGRYYKRKYDYWFRGVYPDFSDCDEPSILKTIWRLEKPKLDNNHHEYYVRSVKAMYATYCRDVKAKYGDVLDILDWYQDAKANCLKDGARNVLFDNVDEDDLIVRNKTPYTTGDIG